MWKKLKYEAWSQVLALIDQRAHGGQKSLFTVDNWEREIPSKMEVAQQRSQKL